MIESGVSHTNRFSISKGSVALLKDARIDLSKLKEKFPELVGMAFFGSRTLGREKSESDIDCVLFTKSNELPNGIMGCASQITEKIEEELNSYQKSKNPLVMYSVMGVVDISQEATDKDITDFRYLVGEQKRGRLGFTREKTTLPHPSAGKLITRFFLGTGEGLYKNRRYVLEKLAQEKDGEMLWQKIIEYLSYFERTGKTTKRSGLPSYENYPKTIVEAKKFFKTWRLNRQVVAF